MEEKPLACSSCGGEQFACIGLVGYQQRYDGAWQNPPVDRWEAMEPNWEIDYPLSIECRNCGTDMTQFFLAAGILASVYTNPEVCTTFEAKP